jgi:uridylate kinase
MKVVLKIGGHVFPATIQTPMVSAYSELLRELRRSGHQLVAITGGGEAARKYSEAARALGATEFTCDLLGIHVSRLNARLLISALGDDAYPEPLSTYRELVHAVSTDTIVVGGGMHPGQSTDTVGALVAEALRADWYIKATDVEGVYTADPNTDPGATKIEEITPDELLRHVMARKLSAGEYTLFDPIAIKIVERAKIATRIVDGRTAKNVARVIEGHPLGTLIKPRDESQ